MNNILERTIKSYIYAQLDKDDYIYYIPTVFKYSINNPYAVIATFTLQYNNPIEWIFARSLLSNGLNKFTGNGNIHIWPTLSNKKKKIILLWLHSSNGDAILRFNKHTIQGFLSNTYKLVPLGSESKYTTLTKFDDQNLLNELINFKS